MAGVVFRCEGRVAQVQLDRPEHLNALTDEMEQSLAEAWARINEDPDIWCAILSASGDKAFCIGADTAGGRENPRRIAFGGGLTGVGGLLATLKKPLIAAVQGFCVGGGFELAMCADIIVAADTAQFGLPETKVGIIGDCGVVHRAIRQLPHHVAMAMILTGRRIGANDAERFGLVNEVVAPDDLDAAALRWADAVIAASPLANQAAKAAAIGRLGYPLEVALMTRYEEIELYADSDDRKEGAAAAASRRKPVWTGR
jgi:enoyl-CoA hydratase/carnithine racemase